MGGLIVKWLNHLDKILVPDFTNAGSAMVGLWFRKTSLLKSRLGFGSHRLNQVKDRFGPFATLAGI